MTYYFQHEFKNLITYVDGITSDNCEYHTKEECIASAEDHFQHLDSKYFDRYDRTYIIEMDEDDDDLTCETEVIEAIDFRYEIRLESFLMDEYGRRSNTDTMDITYEQSRPDTSVFDYTLYADDVDSELIPEGCDEIYWYEIWHRDELIWSSPFCSVRELLEM